MSGDEYTMGGERDRDVQLCRWFARREAQTVGSCVVGHTQERRATTKKRARETMKNDEERSKTTVCAILFFY